MLTPEHNEQGKRAVYSDAPYKYKSYEPLEPTIILVDTATGTPFIFPAALASSLMEDPDPDSQPEPAGVVEGTLAPHPDTEEEAATAETETAADDEAADPIVVDIPAPTVSASPRRRLSKSVTGVLVALACLLLGALVLVGFYVVPLVTATASVTLLPVETSITSSTILTVTTSGRVSATTGTVPGRLLSALTLSEQRTVPATGTGHQDAAAAHGLITFYNAATFTQTVAAGTLLTGSDGVQVVTDADAVIPAASYPTFGQATVAAHTVQVGPSGNIGAGDIYGPCCRESISAANSAFTGGHTARTFRMVTAQDIATAASDLRTGLASSVQAAYAAQIRATETLITPVACIPVVSTTHPAGAEAPQVTVRLDETCLGETYDTQAVQTQVAQQVSLVANKQLGPQYTRQSDVQVRVQQVTVHTGPHGSVQVRVQGTGVWAYQFTDAQLHQLAKQVAGESRAQATALLLNTAGVSQVAMNISGLSGTLPTNPSRIQVLVVYQP